MVFWRREWSTRSLGSYRGRNAVGIRRKRTSCFPCNDSIVQGYSQVKGHGKLSIHFTADYPAIETVFRIIVSANQLSLYGAVANICEEFEALQDRSGEPDVLMGQSIVLSEIKAEVLFCRMKTLHIIKFYGKSMKNESNCFHQKAK